MPSINALIDSADNYCEALNFFKSNSKEIAKVFAPLEAAGFKDFEWINAGSSSFLIAPTDNKDIVFRVTNESWPRTNQIPFFLASPYVGYREFPEQRENIRVEVLLRGDPVVTDKQKDTLIKEMKAAGWRVDQLRLLDNFWKDIVAVKIRKADGRIKAVPLVSDPTAFAFHMDNCRPFPLEQPDGTLVPPNLNKCSEDFVTLQDQARTYNAVIENDPRLKKLIPEPVKFPETEIVPATVVREP